MAHLMPQQIGLLGINNSDWTCLTTPSISTVVEPVREVGQRAYEMLLDLLDGKAGTTHQEILGCETNWLDSTL